MEEQLPPHLGRTSTLDVLHKYGADYKVVFVGDAAMAPYEITQPGGSVEHWNEEAGYVWMQRFMEKYKKLIWINPIPRTPGATPPPPGSFASWWKTGCTR